MLYSRHFAIADTFWCPLLRFSTAPLMSCIILISGDELFGIFVETLECLPNIQVLDLSCTGITVIGLGALADVCRKNVKDDFKVIMKVIV